MSVCGLSVQAYEPAVLSAALQAMKSSVPGAYSSIVGRELPKNIYQQERDRWAARKDQKRFEKMGPGGVMKSYTNYALTDPSRYQRASE